MNVQTKICTGCGVPKVLKKFSKAKTGLFGVRGDCKVCEKARKKAYYIVHIEEKRAKGRASARARKGAAKAYYEANKNKIITQTRAYRKANKEKIKIYREVNREKRTIQRKVYQKSHKKERNTYNRLRNRIDSKYKLNKNMRTGIWQSLKLSKGGRAWKILVDYTIDDLITHIEKKFVDGMTWDNYGKDGWVIDHKIPISVFNFTNPEHRDFKRCWSLSNLQPMWEHDNCIKHTKLINHFQPSLLL